MDKPSSGLSRRGFMGSVGAGGLAVGASLMGHSGRATAASAIDVSKVTTPVTSVQALPNAYYLTNVRFETGFVEEKRPWLDAPVISRTRTELKTVCVTNGAITEILEAKSAVPPDAAVYDAQGQLMLPTFRDMHIHLDKTFYGGPWEATLPTQHGRADRVAQEQELLPKLLPVAEERTAAMIRLMHSQGTTVCRSHCNVDPVSKLGNLEHLKASLARFKDTLDSRIIIFPQHGLLASDSVGLMREALKSGGVSFVGGVDPTSFDHAMEKSVDTTVQLAIDFNAGIDIHIHEPRATAIPAFNRFMDHVEKNKQLQGNVTFSHAYSLAELSKDELKDIAARMKALDITLASAVPLGKGAMPLREVHEAGVKVICGTDSVMDWWNSFGNCDILQKAQEIARLQYPSTEYDISRTLGYATGFVTPLNDKGEQAWPKAGDEASFNLLPASCSAEAVARLPVRNAVFHKGRLVYGAVPKAV
ncbi:amidohydrolase [Variovorax sp. Sphag1AA]|uniref:amidohydrolase n=1 Tax=Variovorax sp. Sphag1AA TaxID=2587027 RepID=UPI00161F34E9|nr:amidohydrolase [Variovorax sp. Sphag1AA]MBB3178202.1 cytosine/adenosine deaminase-related metal-dependent hydrolase [Variovorax sp. Sphag1AA]